MQPQSTSPEDIYGVVQELIELANESASEVAEFEVASMAKLMEIGRALMKRRLEALTPTEEFVDGVLWRVAVNSGLRVMTSFGAVVVDRPLFRAHRNGPTRCLVQERAPLMAGFWTEKAAKLGALAIAEMPMERAEQFFAEAGCMPVSRSSLLRLGGHLSNLWEEDRQANEQAVREVLDIPDEAKAVAVSIDGVMVLMTDSNKAGLKAAARARGQADKGPAGWREASVGVISFYDAEGERLHTRRYGRMPEENKATTKSWLRMELEHIRTVRPDLKVLAIADGAANNWTFLSDVGADHELVDFFHTAEHLHRHVSKANGASTLETQQKLRDMRHQLLEVPGAATKVFANLQEVREQAGTEALSTRKTKGKRQPTYFERHKDRLNYSEIREQNLPIGTGVTESTCKLTICDRLRRTGMRWSQSGGQAVVTLRAHVVSGAFDPAWNVLTEANHRRLAA